MRRLGTAGIVFVGLLMITRVPEMLQSAVSLIEYSERSGAQSLAITGLSLAPVGIALVLGYWLIRERNSLSARWFDDEQSVTTLEPKVLLRLAITVLGIALVVQSVPAALISMSTTAIQATAAGGDVGGFGDDSTLGVLALYSLTALVYPIVNLGIGVFLVLRAELLTDRLWSLPLPRAVEPIPDMALCPRCGTPYDESDYEDLERARCVSCGASLRDSDA